MKNDTRTTRQRGSGVRRDSTGITTPADADRHAVDGTDGAVHLDKPSASQRPAWREATIARVALQQERPKRIDRNRAPARALGPMILQSIILVLLISSAALLVWALATDVNQPSRWIALVGFAVTSAVGVYVVTSQHFNGSRVPR